MQTCYATLCPRREECTLWHNALFEMEKGYHFLQIISPKVIESAGGYDHCPHFFRWELRTYARGLHWHYGGLTGDAEDAIHRRLEEHFGPSLAGRIRRGDEVVSPEDQAYIRDLFAEFSSTVRPEYRSFEQHYNKPPRRA